MIVLNVIYRCKPNKREDFLERIIAEGIDVASRAEDGNIKYDYYIPYDGSEDLLLIEKWMDEVALAAHAVTEHFGRLKELKPIYVQDTVIERFEV